MAGVLLRSCVFWGVCVWAADIALAQPSAVEPTRSAMTVTELLERLDALQRRVEALERQLASSREASEPTAAVAASAATTTNVGATERRTRRTSRYL